MYAWNPQAPGEDIRAPGAEVTGIFKQPNPSARNLISIFWNCSNCCQSPCHLLSHLFLGLFTM